MLFYPLWVLFWRFSCELARRPRLSQSIKVDWSLCAGSVLNMVSDGIMIIKSACVYIYVCCMWMLCENKLFLCAHIFYIEFVRLLQKLWTDGIGFSFSKWYNSIGNPVKKKPLPQPLYFLKPPPLSWFPLFFLTFLHLFLCYFLSLPLPFLSSVPLLCTLPLLHWFGSSLSRRAGLQVVSCVRIKSY